MLWHAVRAICVPPVEHVFVVLAPEDRAFSRHDWSAFAGKLEPLYCGGGTRRDSVYNGLVAAMAAVDADDWMLVHDAARPCRSEEHTSELQSQSNLVCRLLLEKKNLHLLSGLPTTDLQWDYFVVSFPSYTLITYLDSLLRQNSFQLIFDPSDVQTLALQVRPLA